MTDSTLVRRLMTVPAVVVLTLVVCALLPVLLTVAVVLDVIRWLSGRRPAMATRLVVFLFLYLLGELWAIVALGAAGLLGPARSTGLTYRLQSGWASWVFSSMKWVFGLTFDVEGLDRIPPGPIVLLARHASLVDTLIPSRFVTREHGIRLRYVLKRELLLDPALDIAGNRLPNYFVDRGAGASDAELAAIRELAGGMGGSDGLLIYPEGTRFSVEKRSRYTGPLVAKGGVIGEIVSTYESVLPPRPGGTLAVLEAADADVVVLAHRGLEGFAQVKDVWSGGLVDSTIEVAFWRVPREAIPQGRAERVEWLYRLWADVDVWVTARGRVE